MLDLWWTKQHCRRFSSSTSVSTGCSTLIIQGWYDRPVVQSVPLHPKNCSAQTPKISCTVRDKAARHLVLSQRSLMTVMHWRRMPCDLVHHVKIILVIVTIQANRVLYQKVVQVLNSMVWVRKWTIPTKGPPLVGEVSANFGDRGCQVVSMVDPYGHNQLHSRGRVDPVPDPLLRKSGSAGDRTRNSDHRALPRHFPLNALIPPKK
jgi:hypothetical protein